jgi:hypothetical protein
MLIASISTSLDKKCTTLGVKAVNNGVVTLQSTLVNGVYVINITGSNGKVVTQKLVVNN